MANGKPTGRILVIRIDFLGDMLCTTAFLGALKQRWPDAELHVVANRYNAAALAGNPDVHTVHTYVYSRQCERNDRPGRMRAFFDRLRLVRRLRRLRFDLVVVPNGGMHRSSIQFARQLGVKDCRWHDADSEFDDRKPEHVASRPMCHEALSGFRLVPELGRTELEGLKLSVHPDRALQEAPAHVVDAQRAVQERRDFIECGQFAIARRELRGLLPHVLFQARVRRLQLAGHPVEALREIAEFVACVGGQTRVELARRDAREPVAQPDHRQDDP